MFTLKIKLMQKMYEQKMKSIAKNKNTVKTIKELVQKYL
ncbi:pneumococcal histidine triad protein E [Streptococcus pneumoniae GA17971]|nr:pneumococcal histidine triad protein E [Streptococcus pneumoniae GA17971]